MSKDQSGTEIKVGDRVTITGEVIHVHPADSAPCQVKVDVPAGDDPLTVSFESRILHVSGKESPPAPKAEPPKAPEPPAAPAANSVNPPPAK